MATPKKTAKKAKSVADSYDRFKIFRGKQYTGMAVGRSHKWYYDKGVWLDKKLTPDKWQISFNVMKRRAGKAPEGSGARVGTEYHWYILAHQMVKKVDANSYTTSMNGLKFKLAHKRGDKASWSISDKTQREHLIGILEDFIEELRAESIEQFVMDHENPVKKKPATEKAVKKSVTRKKKPEPEPA